MNPDIPTLTLHPLAGGVFVWLQPDGGSGVSNAGVIVDDDGITVIDTLMVRAQWEPFAAAVRELGEPVRRVVLTHAHIDHVGGTKAFPGAAIYGSPLTSDLLDEPMALRAYQAFMPAFAEAFEDLAEIGTRPVTHLVNGVANLTPRLEILPASGHTPGDLMVLVEDCDVLFAGGLCSFGVTPLAFGGDPRQWADTLEAVADLGDTIVPGHGHVGRDDDVRVLRDYLRACVAANGDVHAMPPGPWDAWRERDFDAINIERAALLAAGEDTMPPSMVRAIGLGL